MKHKDTLTPYVLASGHPMLHLSLLTTGLVLHTIDNDGFYNVPNESQCLEGASSKAMRFIKGDKFFYIGLIGMAHLLSVVFHYINELLVSQQRRILGNLFMVLKIFFYLFAIFKVQTGIIFEECREKIVDESQVMAWLSYEVFAFYFNIVAMGVFLLFSSFKKFFSIKDRVGLCADSRRTQDFLVYCKDDLHWFCMWFTQLMLTILSLVMRTRNHEKIQWVIGVLFARFLLEVFVMRAVYFSSTFEIKSYVRVIMVIVFVLNCFLLKMFMNLEEEFTVWWGQILLQDVIIHFYIFLQIMYEWANWDTQLLEWQKEIAFNEQLKQQDYNCDEKQVRLNIELLASPLTVSQQKAAKENYAAGATVNASNDNNDDAVMDQSYKPLKNLKLASNIYTVSYCCFLKSNRTKLRLKTSDQVDVFYRALFMFTIQGSFMVNIVMHEKFDFGFQNDVLINFCMLFSVLLLHWSSLSDVRSGIYMMKYAICCPDEFDQPVTAFLLGLVQTSTVIFLQCCNLVKNLQQKSATGVMFKFASFGLIAGIPKMLAGSMETFEASKSVGTLKLTRSRKRIQKLGNEDQKIVCGWLFNPIYSIYKWFFVSVYYYFFPFVVIFLPLFKLAYLHQLE